MSEPAAQEPAAEQGREGRRRRQAEPEVEASGEMHDAARLVAIEMAVAGRTRDEVDRHLRGSFRIEDTGGLLDDVFGGDSPDTSRSSWGPEPAGASSPATTLAVTTPDRLS